LRVGRDSKRERKNPSLQFAWFNWIKLFIFFIYIFALIEGCQMGFGELLRHCKQALPEFKRAALAFNSCSVSTLDGIFTYI